VCPPTDTQSPEAAVVGGASWRWPCSWPFSRSSSTSRRSAPS